MVYWRYTKMRCSIQRYPTVYRNCTMRYSGYAIICPFPAVSDHGMARGRWLPVLRPSLWAPLHSLLLATMAGAPRTSKWDIHSRVAGWSIMWQGRTRLCYCTNWSWLVGHHRLDLYQFLAPNAYPRLDTFVDTTERRVSSQVYEVMPLFEWCDGSHKYLHVDVPLMEQYQVGLCED